MVARSSNSSSSSASANADSLDASLSLPAVSAVAASWSSAAAAVLPRNMSSAAAMTTRLTKLHDRLTENRNALATYERRVLDARDRVKKIDDELAQLENMEHTAEVAEDKKRLQNLQTAHATSLSKFTEAITQKEATITELEDDIETLESAMGNSFACFSIGFR
jgi:TolA-binding protein